MKTVSFDELLEIFKGESEIAVLDMRERNPYSKEQLLRSSCLPLSQLELMVHDLVPRLATPIVVMDQGPGDPQQLALRGARRLAELGYTDVSVLEGGLDGLKARGHELFEGVGAYSKAFGEWVAETYHTPYRKPEEQNKIAREGRVKQRILDCRPQPEYHRMTIPNSSNAPGADLVYRVFDAVDDEQSEVIVHCAGRTRSIIGTQSLINAGLKNPVMALENGTMGWQLAGFELEYGQTRDAALPSAAGLAKGRQAADLLTKRFGVRKVSAKTLQNWMQTANQDYSLYVIDVRLPHEYAAGHLPGSRNVQGGQLVQATDEYIATFNARIVLVDDTEIRATMTASWLIQLGWLDVYVLENGIASLPLSKDSYQPTYLGIPAEAGLNALDLQKMLDAKQDLAILDLSLSSNYSLKHIPGAYWAIRARLNQEAARLPKAAKLILTSEDGALAQLTARDIKQNNLYAGQVLVLNGGNKAWEAAGLPLSQGMEKPISEPNDDVWYMPYMHPDAPVELKLAYFEWEYGLVAQTQRDGTAKYRVFPEV